METLREIAEAAGGRIVGPAGAGESRPTGASIDSRTLKPGDLFFAIAGPRHDGHTFVADAFGRGAAAAVVSNASVVTGGRTAIVVADTLQALQDAAAARRRRIGARVVGITGSSGKTTTKEMTRQVLSGSFNVMASRGNLNNLYGLPLSLFDLEDDHQVAVLEMGISSHGEMRRLAAIADPDVGILTNLYGAHLEFFADLDDYARAKAELFQAMRPNTTGIFNGDDERSRRMSSSFHGYAATFGMDTASDFTATHYRGLGLEGCSFTFNHSGRAHTVRLRFAGAHHAMNALAALACGYLMGCDTSGMIRGLEALEPLSMRGQVLRLRGGARVLDDSYNANPGAMRAALAVLAQTEAGEGRRIAVIGDMLELGTASEDLHGEIGRLLALSGIDHAFAVGQLARVVARAAAAAGFSKVTPLETADEAAELLVETIGPGDVILVKGSRSVGLDRVVAALRERLGEGTAAAGEA